MFLIEVILLKHCQIKLKCENKIELRCHSIFSFHTLAESISQVHVLKVRAFWGEEFTIRNWNKIGKLATLFF